MAFIIAEILIIQLRLIHINFIFLEVSEMTANRALLVTVLLVAQLADITVVGESLLFQVYEAGNVNLSRWYDMIDTVSKSMKTDTAEEVQWKLANESCNNTAHSELPAGKISMCDSYKEAVENSSVVSMSICCRYVQSVGKRSELVTIFIRSRNISFSLLPPSKYCIICLWHIIGANTIFKQQDTMNNNNNRCNNYNIV